VSRAGADTLGGAFTNGHLLTWVEVMCYVWGWDEKRALLEPVGTPREQATYDLLKRGDSGVRREDRNVLCTVVNAAAFANACADLRRQFVAGNVTGDGDAWLK
jgi:hypothetical protein